MRPRPKPLLGLVLGLLLGAVIVGLLWQLGVAPPDRFILFGIFAVAIALTELLLTQTTRRGKGRFVTVMVIAGVFGGVALTGVPETFAGTGSLSDGCDLEVTSGDVTVTPDDTAPFDPLDTTPTGTLEWTSSTDEVLTNWSTSLGMVIGGVPIPMFTSEVANSEHLTEWSGESQVSAYLDEIEDQTGLELRGTFHVAGSVDADEDDCTMAGYVRVNAEGVFATPLIIGLWALGAVLLVMIVWIAVSVGRSVGASKRSTPAAAAAPMAESAAEPAAPVGAFSPPDEAKTEQPASPEPVVKKEEVVTEKTVVKERTVPGDDAVPPTQAMPVADDQVTEEFATADAVEMEPEPEAEPDGEPDGETEPATEATDGDEPTEASGSDEEPRRP